MIARGDVGPTRRGIGFRQTFSTIFQLGSRSRIVAVASVDGLSDRTPHDARIGRIVQGRRASEGDDLAGSWYTQGKTATGHAGRFACRISSLLR